MIVNVIVIMYSGLTTSVLLPSSHPLELGY